MADLYTRIENLCKSAGITITKMCAESGASRASLTDLKNGRKKTLSAKTLSAIASYLGVTTDYLLGLVDEYGLSPADWAAMGASFDNYMHQQGRNLAELVDGQTIILEQAEQFVSGAASLTPIQLVYLCGMLGVNAVDFFEPFSKRLWPENKKAAAQGDGLEVLYDDERALLHSYRTMTEEQKSAMAVFLRGIKNAD